MKAAELIALPILALVRNLYDVEREAKDRWPVLTLARPDPQELEEAVAGRLALRRGKSAPLLEKLKQRLLPLKDELLPKSGLGGAVGYALGHWETLSRFLENGLAGIDNIILDYLTYKCFSPAFIFSFLRRRIQGCTLCSWGKKSRKKGVRPKFGAQTPEWGGKEILDACFDSSQIERFYFASLSPGAARINFSLHDGGWVR